MHYTSTAFSRNEDPTIEPKNPSIDLDRLGQREGFSINDVHHVRALYCAGKVKSTVLFSCGFNVYWVASSYKNHEIMLYLCSTVWYSVVLVNYN